MPTGRGRWRLQGAKPAGKEGGEQSASMSQDLEIVPLFATPLVVHDVPDAAALNADLRRVIEERESPTPAHRLPTKAAGSRPGTWSAGAACRR